MFNGIMEDKMEHDRAHGGPFDRGGADYYYHRPYGPHYYDDSTNPCTRVEKDQMTQQQLDAYEAGWNEAEQFGDQKIF